MDGWFFREKNNGACATSLNGQTTFDPAFHHALRGLNSIVKGKASPPAGFIRETIDEHMRTNRFNGWTATWFFQGPGDYLLVGYAKSVCFNFGFAA